MGDSSQRDDAVPARRGAEPVPLGGLADLAELLGGDTDRSRRFLGGLVAGAAIGAALAGALLMNRRRPPAGGSRGVRRE